MRSCSPSPSNPSKPDTIKIVKYDTLWIKGKDSIVYKPGETQYIPGDTVFKDVDTLAILKDYFAKRVYEDTIKIDTFGYVLVKDTISQNKIQNRYTSLSYELPVITKTVDNYITLPPKMQLYGGFDIIVNNSPINYFGPSLLLKTKKDHIYTAGLGLSTNENSGLAYKFGTLWKIKIKK